MSSPRPSLSSTVRAFVVGCIIAAYRPRPTLNVWRWAEKWINLDPLASPAFPGQYDSSINPYTRFIQEFATDPYHNEFIVMKSSQSGFTEAILNIIRYLVANKPTNILYAINALDEARKISKTRLQPSLEKCPETAQAIGENADDFGNLTMFLRGMVLYMIGAHSAGAFANKPVGMIILDELDKHPVAPDGEAETIDLARQRFKTIPDGKLIALSTPKKEEDVTYREYLTGTQHKFFVPCPHCQAMQELVWHRVKFGHCIDMLGEYDLERVKVETYYECEACKKPILESHKNEMLQAGEWRQTNPKPFPGRISCHISDLYSPFANATWGMLAMEWINAQTSIVKLQNFFNGRLGLPSKQQTAEVKEADVVKLRGAYKRGQCPFEPVLITMTSDKQGDVLKWTKAGWKATGECAIIDYGYTLVEDELLEEMDVPVECLGSTLRPTATIGLIDEGFAQTIVRDFVVRSEGRWYASKGRGGIQVRSTVHESPADHKDCKLTIYHYDDDDFKKQLYLSRIAKFQDILDGKCRVPRLWLPANIDQDLVDELIAEKLVKEKNKWGYTKEIWKKTGDKNDFGDAVKMQLVLWHILGAAYQD